MLCGTLFPRIFIRKMGRKYFSIFLLFSLIIFHVPFSMLFKHKKIVFFNIFFSFPLHFPESKYSIRTQIFSYSRYIQLPCWLTNKPLHSLILSFKVVNQMLELMENNHIHQIMAYASSLSSLFAKEWWLSSYLSSCLSLNLA